MMYQTIRLVKEGRLARLYLNRPAAMNAMDDVMMKELADAFEALRNDASVQVLILQGEGRAFSAGGDIKKMIDPESPMDIGKVMVDVTRLAKGLYSLPQVTIAAIHGAAAGLGFSMALGCDVIVAEEDSKLAMNFIGIGLVPDGAGHFFLKERIGIAQAKQLIWKGDVMTGSEAEAKGLVDQIVPSGQLDQTVSGLAAHLLASPIQAMLATKKILHAPKMNELDDMLQMESEAQVAMRSTADHLEGIQAFIEKRKPSFTGK
ncbi:enoyl-CoA hydratase [Sporosarcina cyprini]|uniref:enoyl-CoA hydratase n=1 Tax=Sporosarcina cyprini TaxID=2910523 RepID=UPI001EE01229|nr:enoyl-CoA hydratase [Sporosarcina cyprini]MCG3088683.1 enoyl-CoA hydratase [Sporosarcina cyprini]